MEMVYAGIVVAIAMIFLMLKLDIKKVCGYDIYVDIGFTGALMLMLSGSYAGMMAAIIAGAIISIFLYTTKKLIGYKKLEDVNGKSIWVTYK